MRASATLAALLLALSACTPSAGNKPVKSIAATKASKQAVMAMHQQMMVKYSGNTDVDFARGMAPHHQGAIDMAKVELQYGTDDEMRELAERIVTWQEEERQLMQRWLDTRGSGKVQRDLHGKQADQAYKKQMDEMHRDMMIAYTNNPDADFVSTMIPHHQAALDMASIELKYGFDPELRGLASDIIRAQQQEIGWMKTWQKQHGYKTRYPASKTMKMSDDMADMDEAPNEDEPINTIAQ